LQYAPFACTVEYTFIHEAIAMSESKSSTIERPPVVAIMGHVDHGKSTLLDYIRNANVVDTEFGGITQHVSAYEVAHTNAEGTKKHLTFIDTPGHAAFSGMRQRGAAIADIAILIVSAEDSIKPQTIEAIEIIKTSGVPYVVAINKIDKPNANPDKVKTDLLEHEVYLEGFGGEVPYNEISAKVGTGVDELLETILLVAELQEFTGNADLPASGYIVESHQDSKRGVTATLIIKNGAIKKGQYVVAGCGMASTRILEDFTGKSIDEARFSSPIRIIGFSSLCNAGSDFQVCESKKEAEEFIKLADTTGYMTAIPSDISITETTMVPIILKCDVAGMIEAVAGEIEKLSGDGIYFRIVRSGVGAINETDVVTALTDPQSLIIGFNVDIDNKTDGINERDTVNITTWNIIYKMSEWLQEYKETKRFKKEVEEVGARAKILKIFSHQKGVYLLGASVSSGILAKDDRVRVSTPAGDIISYGKIVGMQQAKSTVTKVDSGEFGMMIEATGDIKENYTLETFTVTQK